MSFDSDKNLAGVGAIIVALGYIVSPILIIVGFVLLLVGINRLASYYGEKSIFDNFLYGFIIEIVGIVVTVLITLAIFFSISESIISPPIGGGYVFGPVSVGRFLSILFFILIVSAIFTLVAVLFFRRGLSILKEKTGIDLFGTGALILLIGAVLTFVFIGSIILLAGWIVLGVAFFSLKPKETTQTQITQT